MKIVFLHRANDPYTIERIKYLAGRGNKVTSISFSIGGVQKDIPGVEIFRLETGVLDKVPLAKRIIHKSKINSILKKLKPDIYHVVSALNLFYSTSHFSKVRVIENQGSDVLLTPIKHPYLKYYYNYYYKKISGVIQDSEVAYRKGIEFGAPSDPAFNKIIEIGIDFNIFNKNVSKGVVRNKYNLKSKKVVFSSRGTNPLYNMDIILKSIPLVRREFPEVVFLFTAEKDKLSESVSKIISDKDLLPNLLFVGYQNRIESLKYFYRDADLCISVPSSDSSPFSVYESMACMTPNVVTDLPWLYSKFIPGKHLEICPVRNYEKLAEEIIKVLEGKSCIDLNSAFQVVNDYINLEKENFRLEEFYKSLLKR